MDGALDDSRAREALAGRQRRASSRSQPIWPTSAWSPPAQLAAANSVEFGVPLLDVSAFDPAQSRDQAGQRGAGPQAQRAAAVQARQPPVRRHRRPDQHPGPGRDQVPDQPGNRTDPRRRRPPAAAPSTSGWKHSRRPRRRRGTTRKGWRTSTSPAATTDLSADSGVDVKTDDTPVVKFVNKVLVDAIRRGASDIHFEPYETDYRVRLRIDGAAQAGRPRSRRSCHGTHRRAPEGDGAARHRREARAAGRPHQAQHLRRPSRSTSASAPCPRCSARRSCCVSSTAAPPSWASTNSATTQTSSERFVRRGAVEALRHGAGHRPDRFGQDRVAVHRPEHPQQANSATSPRSRTRSKSACRASTRCR